MRRRVRVAPPVDEAEDEGSYQDEFLPFEPLTRCRVEVKVKVDLEEQVIVGRESYKRINLQIRILRKLHLYQRLHRVQHRYLQPYRRCNLCISKACQTQRQLYSMSESA